MEILISAVWFVLIAMAVCFVCAVALYVLYSLALYRGLSACGYNDAWMAWIPVARQYALADCAVHGMDRVYIGGTPFPGWLFRFYWAIMWILAMIPYAGWILAAALKIFVEGPCYAAIYGVVDGRDPRDEILVGYISSIVQLVPIVKLWNAGRR